MYSGMSEVVSGKIPTDAMPGYHKYNEIDHKSLVPIPMIQHEPR